MTTIDRPTTVEELAEAIRTSESLRVQGTGTRLAWVKPWSGHVISTEKLTGIVSLRPEDGVAVVRAGTQIEPLLAELAGSNLALPLAVGLPREISQRGGTVGGLVATGLPHSLEAAFGPVRDMVLGLTVVRGDGSVCQVGSHVLKSVAGFDIHRFAVGSRGSLFAVAEVVLRLRRVASLQAPQVKVVSRARAQFVARVLPSHLEEAAKEQKGMVATDPCGLLWTAEPVTGDLGPGWWIGPNGTRSRVHSPSLEHAAKETMDRDGKFAPGWHDGV